MNRTFNKHRLGLRIATLSLLLSSIPQGVTAAVIADATFEFHPHCESRTAEKKDDTWALGPIPSPGIVANTGDGRYNVTCTEFTVRDPQTVETRPLRNGDILDIDIVIHNPSEQDISRARSWLSYDPDVLQGDSIEIHTDFPMTTPGEQDFSREEGYAKIGASTDAQKPDTKNVMFARVQFTVLDSSVGQTPITFYDPQLDGHTTIMTQDGSDEVYALEGDPGVLLVVFGEGSSSSTQAEQPAVDTTTAVVEESTAECVQNSDCATKLCVAGVCAAPPAKLPNGESCITDNQCESGFCGSGVCSANIMQEKPQDASPFQTEQNATPPVATTGESRTAFSLLQIQNLRATTEGSSIFLSWNPLQSNLLKAYNVYYGTTSGRYIQRKTIDSSESSITIRSLSIGTTYYLAVRALSTTDEESAFSQEVSVTVGSPGSSSAPLVLGSVLGNSTPSNPLSEGQNTVPGETGIPSIVLAGALIAAMVGTGFASRRQFAVTPYKPHV